MLLRLKKRTLGAYLSRCAMTVQVSLEAASLFLKTFFRLFALLVYKLNTETFF